jgi:branched-chain amino acid transport system ATP-binding protein
VILEVKDIHAYYGDSYILQGVSLGIPKGDTVAMLGRNGMGKTTLIRSIIGFTPPRKGEILFQGKDISRLTPNQIARLGIGLIPQGRRIFRSLTVLENLLVSARAKGPDSWTLDRIFEIFPRLKERCSHPGNKLSGGEQQMLSISRALIGNPDLFLMDEPTEGLAPLLVDHLIEVLQVFKKNALSILVVEQNLNFALELADHIYIMTQGKIVYDYSPEAFQENEQAIYRHLGF